MLRYENTWLPTALPTQIWSWSPYSSASLGFPVIRHFIPLIILLGAKDNRQLRYGGENTGSDNSIRAYVSPSLMFLNIGIRDIGVTSVFVVTVLIPV